MKNYYLVGDFETVVNDQWWGFSPSRLPVFTNKRRAKRWVAQIIK